MLDWGLWGKTLWVQCPKSLSVTVISGLLAICLCCVGVCSHHRDNRIWFHWMPITILKTYNEQDIPPQYSKRHCHRAYYPSQYLSKHNNLTQISLSANLTRNLICRKSLSHDLAWLRVWLWWIKQSMSCTLIRLHWGLLILILYSTLKIVSSWC